MVCFSWFPGAIQTKLAVKKQKVTGTLKEEVRKGEGGGKGREKKYFSFRYGKLRFFVFVFFFLPFLTQACIAVEDLRPFSIVNGTGINKVCIVCVCVVSCRVFFF